MPYRLGLIVNPVAGMGGAVGLKGTDGERYDRALALGARPVAAGRAAKALATLARRVPNLAMVTCAGSMGEAAAREAGFDPEIGWRGDAGRSSGRDTADAARELVRRGIDLLMFAGGDGTARDLLGAVDGKVPVLGIPAGVKMHSAVFAPGPRAAGDVAAAFLTGTCEPSDLVDAEVMDREGEETSPRLYGTLRVPACSLWIPHPKAGSAGSTVLDGACETVARQARDDCMTLVGPGATMLRIKERLGFRGTLLGVDAVLRGQLVEGDVGEQRILELLDGREGRIVVSVVGGQGFLFGRGNQPFSPAVIRRVGLDRIVVVASMEKLAALDGRPLFVDTGDESLDHELAGFIPVRTGARRTAHYRVAATGAGLADGQGQERQRT